MNIYKNGCPFCNEFNGKMEQSFFRIEYGDKFDIHNRIIFQTSNFACIPPLGSFCEGYLLIVPKQHVLSILCLPYYLFDEFVEIVKKVAKFYKEKYNKGMIFFEHGTVSKSIPGGMSVIHAHVHCVPCCDLIADEGIYIDDVSFLCFSDIGSVKSYWDGKEHDMPYILFGDYDNKVYFFEGSNIPSQFMRRIICQHIRNDNSWNWKIYPYIENIKKTIADAKYYSF